MFGYGITIPTTVDYLALKKSAEEGAIQEIVTPRFYFNE